MAAAWATSSRLVWAVSLACWAAFSAASASSLRVDTRWVAAFWRASRLAFLARSASAWARTASWTPEPISMAEARWLSSVTSWEAST